ncbi:MAG: metallophosphoesterase family protein [Solirubrobacterales bacterium]
MNEIPPAARLVDDADWICEPSDFARYGKPLGRFSWLNPKILWHSRNNVLASISGDPTEAARRAWVTAQRARLVAEGQPDAIVEDFTIERPELESFSCMVIGDTGEGDTSQYAVVPAFLAASQNTEFTVIASDVVYPEGDINEYIGKFFVPYAAYPRPIYAVPGNHDWLDGLAGFMRHFCGAPPPQEKLLPPRHARRPRTAMWLHKLFWRRAGELAPETLEQAKMLRGAAAASGPAQPNMYFCVDTPQLRIVCIDTGILGRLDYEQGEWLRRVSAGPKPKLMVSGKPMYIGASFSPRRILPPEGSEAGNAGFIYDIVTDAANNYVAMISGDVHNYQRHPVTLDDGRVLQCMISGSGGAFMTATHHIPRIDLPGCTERDVVLFPSRGDSLRAYSVILQHRALQLLRRPRRVVRGIPADEAAAIVARRHGLRPDETGTIAKRVSRRSQLLAQIVFPRRTWFDPEKISEALDWDYPPFFKNFMRIDVRDGVLKVSACGVTGALRDQDDPVVIDGFEVDLRAAIGAAGVTADE